MSEAIARLAAALAGRYEIERELGEGGMATVYLAKDIKHQRRVALKVLRPELAATLGTDRFLQEVRVTANLQHPHILPLFDSGEADGFLYYVMPYLEGESLRDRVAREGELPVGEAVKILSEVVDALAAAHQMGVVHRDIKPDNVMLSGRHAVVADFGVAKAVSEATGRHELTTKGVALGTPAYMAPEQAAANEHIDHRADIYAVGAMGYELLAGRPPFSGMTAQQVLAAHVTEAPRAVTEHRGSVPQGLGDVLMRCLEKKPADRWQTAEELLGQLELYATPTTAGATPTQMIPTRATTGTPMWMKVAAPVALVGIALAVWMGGRETTGADATGDVAPVPQEVTERLVVLPLENLTSDPDLDVLGQLAADQMARSIDQAKPVPVVPSSTVRDVFRQLGDGATSEQVAEAVQATHVIAGTVARTSGQVRIEIELVDVRSGERLRTFDPIVGPADSAEALTAQVAVQATAGAVAHLAPDSPPWLAEYSLPVSLEAYEHYMRQQDHFCSLRYDEALVEGDRTVALSPEYIPALWQNAIVYNNQSRQHEADSVIAVLERLRERMTTSERLSYDWFVGNRLGDPAMSTRAAEEAYRLDPTGGGGSAMMTAWRTGRMNDAVERYYALERPGGCRWTGTWGQGSIAFHALGRFEEELDVAREGLQSWPERRGFMDIEIRAFAGMGRLDAVDSVLSAMEVMAPSSSDPAMRPVYAAVELRAHGHEDEADALLERALRVFRSRAPDDRPYNTARALYYARKWDEAAPIFRQLVEDFPENLGYLFFAGVTFAKLGEREAALEIAERLGAMTRSGLRGAHLMNQAAITAALGDFDEAVRRFQVAFDNGGVHGVWIHNDPALDDIRGYPQFEALMRPR